MTILEGGWIDISLPIDAGRSIAWSGIGAPELVRLADIAEGDSVTVGQLTICLHTGTHADAPKHVGRDGASIERLDPSRFIGPALIVKTSDRNSIRLEELHALGFATSRPERLLIATPCQYDGENFPQAVPHLEVESARWLSEIGVRLIGVNVPSVDPLDSRTLEAHHALFDSGVHILENLVLEGLAPGEYDLVALPLPVVGGDASPVRALVRPRTT